MSLLIRFYSITYFTFMKCLLYFLSIGMTIVLCSVFVNSFLQYIFNELLKSFERKFRNQRYGCKSQT